MRRLGEAKAAAHADAASEHLRLPPIERLRRSMAMSEALRDEANLAARVDDPSEFYARARALGLRGRPISNRSTRAVNSWDSALRAWAAAWSLEPLPAIM